MWESKWKRVKEKLNKLKKSILKRWFDGLNYNIIIYFCLKYRLSWWLHVKLQVNAHWNLSNSSRQNRFPPAFLRTKPDPLTLEHLGGKNLFNLYNFIYLNYKLFLNIILSKIIWFFFKKRLSLFFSQFFYNNFIFYTII